jgi:uncharacterized Zn finger protein (UPF0148 family)
MPDPKAKADIETKKAGEKEEEEVEVNWICLECLNVGCPRGKKGHGEEHFKKKAGHNLAIKFKGGLFCYVCDKEIEELKEGDKAKVSELQRIFQEATSDRIIHPVPMKMEIVEEDKSMLATLTYSRRVERYAKSRGRLSRLLCKKCRV